VPARPTSDIVGDPFATVLENSNDYAEDEVVVIVSLRRHRVKQNASGPFPQTTELHIVPDCANDLARNLDMRFYVRASASQALD
jgi:hypothetical protein